MTYTSILVHADSRDESTGRLKCARGLADRFGAALIGLGAEAIPPVSMDNGYVSYDAMWVANMMEAITENLAAAEKRFHATCDGFGLKSEWRSCQGLPADLMAQVCRGADLVVATGGRQASVYQCARPADLVLQCGRPILIAPPEADHCHAKRVMVAWKDSRESRRALADALPFLKEADDVLVVEICEGEEQLLKDADFRVHDVAAALARHGVAATAEAQPQAGDPAGQRLLERADLMAADLIVAGGYGHSRMGEWVFGGVTKTLLEQDSRFVLLSH
jgi:nucleotide-binding universal stress UspA family protein